MLLSPHNKQEGFAFFSHCVMTVLELFRYWGVEKEKKKKTTQ